MFYIASEKHYSNGIEITLEEIKSILKLELSTNINYCNFTTFGSGVNISKELQLSRN